MADGAGVLGDVMAGTMILGRLLHSGPVTTTTSGSYRLRENRKGGLFRTAGVAEQ